VLCLGNGYLNVMLFIGAAAVQMINFFLFFSLLNLKLNSSERHYLVFWSCRAAVYSISSSRVRERPYGFHRVLLSHWNRIRLYDLFSSICKEPPIAPLRRLTNVGSVR